MGEWCFLWAAQVILPFTILPEAQGLQIQWYGYPTAVCDRTRQPLRLLLFTATTTSTTTTTTQRPHHVQPTTTPKHSTTTTNNANPSLCAAEAIYGEQSEETELLREYRDNVLSKTPEGQEIIKTYYKFSPTVTKLLEQRPLLKNRAKAFIDSMLPGIRKKVEESQKLITIYESKVVRALSSKPLQSM